MHAKISVLKSIADDDRLRKFHLNFWFFVKPTLCYWSLSILRSDITSQIRLFSRECFFTPLWRAIINSVKKTKKGKRNKNLKMPSFWQYLNLTDREKDKSNDHFPSIVQNNRKEGLKLSKVRNEKWLAQIFRKDLTERKLERTRMKIMFSASPSSVFSHKVHNIRF